MFRLAFLLGLAITAPVLAARDADEITLATVPGTVYKLRDPGRAPAESWLFHVVVKDRKGRGDIQPVRAELAIFSGSMLRESTTLPDSSVLRKRLTSYRPVADSLALQRRFVTHEVFDLRFPFYARPVGWKADRVRVTLTLAVAGAGNVITTLDVPLHTFAQKTALIFPLRGPSMVSQGRFNDFGHSGHSNQFAIDVLGLNDEYGPMVKGKSGNEEYAGWGRAVLAPAQGTVVHARNDVPDNGGEGDPLDTYGKLADPMSAVAGNCVVIDHGNGEFSALMHMQQGSVKVKVGDAVAQGQEIGRLGNSGDAFGPHLHYQLQDSPVLLAAHSLPATFSNLPDVVLSRGTYFRPR